MDLSKNTKLLPHIIPALIPDTGQEVTVKEVKVINSYPTQSLELSFDGTPRTLVLNSDKKIARWANILSFNTDNWASKKVKLVKKKFGKNEYIDLETV